MLLSSSSLFITPIASALSSLSLLSRRELSLQLVALSSMAKGDVTKKESIRWGIVGLGDVTEKKSGPPFYKCDGSELVAVMRRTPGKAAEWVKKNEIPGGNCVGYESLSEFLQHPGLDAVYISTRPGTHLEICRAVAEAGKAVYVEKPVGRCAAETQAMMDACQSAHVPFYTAYISRAYARTQAIRALLEEGAIGDRITRVNYRLVGMGGARGMTGDDSLPWRLDAAQAGGGLIMDVGCHVVDRIDWLCGPLVEVTGKAENRGFAAGDSSVVPQGVVEDYVQMDATIGASSWASIPSKGAQVSCVWDFSGRNEQEECDELIIEGPSGSLKMAAMSPSLPVYVCDEAGKVTRTLEFEAPEHTAQECIQAVTNELRGVGSAPFLSRGDNALRTSKVLDSVLQTYYGTRDVGYWSSPKNWPGAPS